MNQIQTASAGIPRSAAICSGTLCRCGVRRVHRVRIAILRVHPRDHVRPDTRERMVARSLPCPPASSPGDRGWTGSRRSKIESIRSVTVSGANAKTSAMTTGRSAVSRKSRSTNSRPTATHAPTQALRVRVSDECHDERRHHERRPRAFARAEDQSGGGGADDQHQRARVGHVV